MKWPRLLLASACVATPALSPAARITEIDQSTAYDRAVAFLTFSDPSVFYAVLGSLLLGGCCGLMGTYLVVRKLSLMGDSLSHAVLPGVALGFLWNMRKDTFAIFVGAVSAGLIGSLVMRALRATTRHKEDAVLGFVLASFFAVGIGLVTMLQNLPGGDKSGLDKYMFGQAAAIGHGDLVLLAIVSALVVGAVSLFHKEYLLVSFDPGFARTLGLRLRWIDFSLMTLVAFAIVSALQAVGVVLVSALLVIPAATATLLAGRLSRVLVLAALLGVVSAGAGTFGSYVGHNLPTGPLITLAAATIFGLIFIFGPRHGLFTRWRRERVRRASVRQEATLKALYYLNEGDVSPFGHVSVDACASCLGLPVGEVLADLRRLTRSELVRLNPDCSGVSLTSSGWGHACQLVREERLLELYQAQVPVARKLKSCAEAEGAGFCLEEGVVKELELRLRFARIAPDGRLVPGIRDLMNTLGGEALPTDHNLEASHD